MFYIWIELQGSFCNQLVNFQGPFHVRYSSLVVFSVRISFDEEILSLFEFNALLVT